MDQDKNFIQKYILYSGGVIILLLLFTIADRYVSFIPSFGEAASRRVTVVAPNGGEKIFVGQNITVSWQSSGINFVELFLVKSTSDATPIKLGRMDDPATKSKEIQTGIVTIPENVAAGSYLLKIDAYRREGKIRATDFSNGLITVSKANQYDLNFDGKVDNGDIKIVADAIDNNVYEQRADVDINGKVNLEDLDWIRGYIRSAMDEKTYLDLTLDGRVDNNDVLVITRLIDADKYSAFADVDINGKVNLEDLDWIRRYIENAPQGSNTFYDLNIDGRVDAEDALMIMGYVQSLGIEIPPIPQPPLLR